MNMYDAEFLAEKDRLHSTVAFMEEEIDAMKYQREHLWENTSSAQVAQHIDDILYQKIKEYKRNVGSPYFARVDFTPNNAKAEVLYIGRTAVNDGAEQVVVDWRAPISSLYYDGKIGPSSYVCPDGRISGNINLKRQYKITNGELLSFADIDITSTDELLQQSLSETSDARLKNIIATIQSEQNQIIRKELKKPIIVQGVAGSGKTTVALHRISYLLYTYSKVLEADKVLILAPNRFFLDYISESLPDLSVENILQKTYEDFATQILNLKYSVVSSNEDLKRVISHQDIKDNFSDIIHFKSCIDFKNVVEAYVQSVETNVFNDVNTDFFINGARILSVEALRDMFETLPRDKSISERISMLKERVMEHLKKICIAYESGYLTDIGNISHDAYVDIKKNGNKLLTKYLSQIRLKDALTYYKDMLNKKAFFSGIISDECYSMMRILFAERLKQNRISFEDLPALLLLHYRILGIKKEDIIKYIVIDEAQDLGSFHFFVLKEMFQTNNITILGDIAQGIYSYRGISDWKKVNEEVFDNTAEIINLTQSYRTTVEVINEANKIANKMQSYIGIELAKAVIRHGEEIHYHCVSGNTLYDDIVSRITQCQKAGHRNIAIIVKDDGQAKKVFESLKKRYQDVNLIDDESKKYFSGVTVLTAYASKGLEFDSVIVINAEDYSIDNIIDGKMLYVAMTRAMHTLDIYYHGKVTEWLE